MEEAKVESAARSWVEVQFMVAPAWPGAKGTRRTDPWPRCSHGCWGQSRSKLVCAKTHPPPRLDWAAVGPVEVAAPLSPALQGGGLVLRLAPTLDEMHALKRDNRGPGTLPVSIDASSGSETKRSSLPSRQRVVL